MHGAIPHSPLMEKVTSCIDVLPCPKINYNSLLRLLKCVHSKQFVYCYANLTYQEAFLVLSTMMTFIAIPQIPNKDDIIVTHTEIVTDKLKKQLMVVCVVKLRKLRKHYTSAQETKRAEVKKAAVHNDNHILLF